MIKRLIYTLLLLPVVVPFLGLLFMVSLFEYVITDKLTIAAWFWRQVDGWLIERGL